MCETLGIMRYIAYLWYVARHKWYVFIECCKLGVPLLGITHDWHKLLPSEFIPYARYFHDADGTPRQIRSKTGYYKPTDTGDLAFDFAWFLHQKRARHHWQWWILPLGNGTIKTLPMPDKYCKEMLADWIGAGRAQGTPDTRAWYLENRNRLLLHPHTRMWIEERIM